MGSRIQRIKQESQGFPRHPVGTFPGVVEDVKQRQTQQGATVFDIIVRTAESSAGRVSIFKTTTADIEEGYGGSLDRVKAEDRYVKTMGRMVRLYRDLGVEEPDGQTDQEVEEKVWGWLGYLKGRPCTLVVQEDRDPKRVGEVRCFINAPRDDAPATAGPAPRLTNTGALAPPTAAAPTTANFDPTQGLDDIPF